ncbi:hypothetical protein P7K49_000025 [Saguinus oedipus]|uniref:Uncharacterized protein n=1 Tax=Saguinus oedipus TaxID=9490 RepID=A0ABQ9WAH5_SAGOE|nr:hypothetical protein P7K49_000025 [Saguinus oedipus]
MGRGLFTATGNAGDTSQASSSARCATWVPEQPEGLTCAFPEDCHPSTFFTAVWAAGASGLGRAEPLEPPDARFSSRNTGNRLRDRDPAGLRRRTGPQLLGGTRWTHLGDADATKQITNQNKETPGSSGNRNEHVTSAFIPASGLTATFSATGYRRELSREAGTCGGTGYGKEIIQGGRDVRRNRIREGNYPGRPGRAEEPDTGRKIIQGGRDAGGNRIREGKLSREAGKRGGTGYGKEIIQGGRDARRNRIREGNYPGRPGRAEEPDTGRKLSREAGTRGGTRYRKGNYPGRPGRAEEPDTEGNYPGRPGHAGGWGKCAKSGLGGAAGSDTVANT